MAYFEKKDQLDQLRLYMIKHKKFAVHEALGKIFTITSDPFSFFHWNEVTDILNGLGPGQKAYEWKYVWKSICFRVFEKHQRDPNELTWEDKQIMKLLENDLKLEEVGDHWYFVRRENSTVAELTEEELSSIYRIEADELQKSPENCNGESSSNINDAKASQNVEKSGKSTLPSQLIFEMDENNEEINSEQNHTENIEIRNNQENCDRINSQVENTEENEQVFIKEENFDTEENQLENNEEEANEQIEIKEENIEELDEAESQAENYTDIRQEKREKNKKIEQENRNKRKNLEIEPNERNSSKKRKFRSRPEIPELQNSNTKIQILRDISEAMKSIAVSFPQIANALINALEKD